MTPQTKYRIGNVLLGIGILLLLFELAEMLEMIPRYMQPRELSPMILVIVIAAGGIRRGARRDMRQEPKAQP